MLIKEAEKKYGKKLAMDIWDTFDLNNISASDGPEGFDIPDYAWEDAYMKILDKRKLL